MYRKWTELTGILASPPALTWDPLAKKIDVLGRSSDNRMWFATLNSDGSFAKDWTSVPGTTPSSPAAAWDSSLQKIQVLVRASNDTLWFGTLNSNGSVHKTFSNISGNTVSAPALVFDPAGNRLFAFVRGGNNEVWFSKFDSQGKTIPVWQAISGRLRQPPAVALNPNNGIAFIVASMPYDYASGSFTYVDDFSVSGPPLKEPVVTASRSSAADLAAVKNQLESEWWRTFYSFNYTDVQSRQGGTYPPGFFLESLTNAYAPSYF